MAIPTSSRRRQKAPPPGDTGQESLYLKFLSEKQVPVAVKLRDGETVTGWIEYFDDRMIRLTREGKPNLFIYKHQIRTITEQVRRGDEVRRRSPRRLPEAGVRDVDSFGVDDPPINDLHADNLHADDPPADDSPVDHPPVRDLR